MEKKMENEMETGIIYYRIGVYRAWCLGFRVQGSGVFRLGIRVQGSGFRVSGPGFKVWGLGFSCRLKGKASWTPTYLQASI